MPRWTGRLAAGDPGVLAKVCHGLKHFHQTKIAPQMPAIATMIARDVKLHSDTVTTGGFETLAETLHPALQSRAPVLHVDMRHLNRDLYLRGRGIGLVPSFFRWRHPIMPADPELPPVLVYPVQHDPACWSRPPQAPTRNVPWLICSVVRAPPYSGASPPVPARPANWRLGLGSHWRRRVNMRAFCIGPAWSRRDVREAPYGTRSARSVRNILPGAHG